MKTKLAAVALAVLLAACSKKEAPPAAAQPAVGAPVHPPEPAPPVVAPPPEPASPHVAPPGEPVKGHAVAAKPPAPPAAAGAAAAPQLGTAHDKVGDAKCRMCHKLQHDSWSASPHAAKGLDCEGCHGGGADFVKVMRDRTAAVAAGLMLPKKEFCKKCHKADWQDAMYLRVHAHKAK